MKLFLGKVLPRYKITLYLVIHLINSLLRRIKLYETRTIPEIQDIRSLYNGDQYNEFTCVSCQRITSLACRHNIEVEDNKRMSH